MRKIRTYPQLILYAMSGLGINLLNTVMNSYLCSALLVGGFAESVLPYQTYMQRDLVLPALWAAFVFAAKLIDGVIDVPMASFSDNLHTRWGRRRPAIAIGLAVLILSYVLFLAVPNGGGATLLNTVYYGLLLCLFYTFYTLTMVTYYATFTEIVDTEDARRFISNTKSVFDIVYFILGYVVVRLLLNNINIRLVALTALPPALTMLIPLFMIREDPSTGTAERAKTVGLVESLRCTVKNRRFIRWMVIYSFMTMGVQLFLSGINEYFSFVGMNMIYVMGVSFVPVPFTLRLYNKILKKRGFVFAFRYILIAFSVGMLAMFAVARLDAGNAKTLLSILCGLICSLAIGAMFSVAYSVPAQMAAEAEAESGVSNSAMYFAVQGLFAGVATGIGSGVILTALKGGENTRSGMIVLLPLIAAAATLVSCILSFALPKPHQK
ncbi:MAG: MFS transporter [Clostridia bacterium]|nr:MFS transporter [Clostridia bacterium]